MADLTTTANAASDTTRNDRALVLVVEDNEKNARMLLTMLAAGGYEAHWAVDGTEGLRLTAEMQPSLVITDLQMPGLDGLEMTRRLKSNPQTAAIPVIALSAHAMAEHAEQSLAAGCVKFLTKPVRYQLLLSEISNALDSASN